MDASLNPQISWEISPLHPLTTLSNCLSALELVTVPLALHCGQPKKTEVLWAFSRCVFVCVCANACLCVCMCVWERVKTLHPFAVTPIGIGHN